MRKSRPVTILSTATLSAWLVAACALPGSDADERLEPPASAIKSPLTPPPGGWPADPNGMWQACMITPAGPPALPTTIVYGDGTGNQCAGTRISIDADGGATETITINRAACGNSSACITLAHENCHTGQDQQLYVQCVAQSQLVQIEGLTQAQVIRACVRCTRAGCTSQMETQCTALGCSLGDQGECANLGPYCAEPNDQPDGCDVYPGLYPSGTGTFAAACNSFSQRSCTCGTIVPGRTACDVGDCPEGQSCTASGNACGCTANNPGDDGGPEAGGEGGPSGEGGDEGSGPPPSP